MDHWFGISCYAPLQEFVRAIEFWGAIVFSVRETRIAITVAGIIHTLYETYHVSICMYVYVSTRWAQYAINGRLAITPSWLFNVSLARANTLENFRCLVITLPVVLYHTCTGLSITFG